MAKSALPLLLGAGALLLLKSKGGGGGAGSTLPTGDEPANGGGGGATGSSGYKNVSASKMKTIQSQLVELGYNPGTIDGQWREGGNTFNAVKAFQGDNGLTVDGKPGPNTRAKLNAMTSTSSGTDSGSSSSSSSGSGSGQSWTQAELNKVPALKSGDEVVFNATLTDYDVGPTWRYATLDSWLNGLRTSGQLATKSNGASEDVTGKSVQYWMQRAGAGIASVGVMGGGVLAVAYGTAAVGAVASAPVAAAVGATTFVLTSVLGTGLQDAALSDIHRMQIEVTGARALERFVKTQSVLVGPERIPVKISQLKRTDAVVEFLKEVTDYIARFQSSIY